MERILSLLRNKSSGHWAVMPRRSWLLLCALAMACVSDSLLADESVWKGYQATALEAERDERLVLCERSWAAAVREVEGVPASGERLFVSLAHLAMAQIDLKKSEEAAATITKAEAQLNLITPDKETRDLPAAIREGRGTLSWAVGRRDDRSPFSIERAKRMREAVSDLSAGVVPPSRLARLCVDSALAQRNCGDATQALRHVQQAIAALQGGNIRDHRLAEALVLRALLLVELARPDEATANLTEWLTIDQELKDKQAENRPQEAAYRLVLARQAMAISDWKAAPKSLAYFRIGEVDEKPVPEHQLLPPGEVLATWIEIQLAQGHASHTIKSIERLKQIAPPGTVSCGRALFLDAVAHLHLGQVSTSRTRLTDSLAQLKAELGAEHPRMIPALNTLALVQSETGQATEGLKAAKLSIQLANKFWPAGHPARIQALIALAIVELQAQHGDEASQFAQQAWDMTVIPWPAGSPDASLALSVLADAEAQSKTPEAAVHLVTLESADLSAMSPFDRGRLQLHRARASHFRGEKSTAMRLYQQSLSDWDSCQSPPAPHPFSVFALLGIAIIEDDGKDQPGEAFKSAFTALVKLRGTEHAAALELSQQGNAFFTADQMAEAIWLYNRAIDAYKRLDGTGSQTAKTIQGYRDEAKAKLERQK